MSIISFEFSENPSKHVVLIKEPEVFTKEDFFKHLHDSTTDRADGIFLFIHGYNVKYVDSILRTGQLVYDLNIDSTAVTYSWVLMVMKRRT